MAAAYLEKLSALVNELHIEELTPLPLEVRHFFSGAALYVDGQICASWSPAGLAFKMPEAETNRLIASGIAKPLKYFAKGHVKKGYALFENPHISKSDHWKSYFVTAIRLVEP